MNGFESLKYCLDEKIPKVLKSKKEGVNGSSGG